MDSPHAAPPEPDADSARSAPPEHDTGSAHAISTEHDEGSIHPADPDQDEYSVEPAHPEHTPIDTAPNAPIQFGPTQMAPQIFNDDDRVGGGAYGFVDVTTVGGVMLARKSFLGGGFVNELAIYRTLQENLDLCPFLIRMLVYCFVIYLLILSQF